jgi:hypothetical protein
MDEIGERYASLTLEGMSEDMVALQCSDNRIIHTLLSAVFRELQRVKTALIRSSTEIRAIASNIEQNTRQSGHPIAEGMLVALCGAVPRDRLNELSVRARNVINKHQLYAFSDLDFETLVGIRGCGAGTVREIVEWKNKILGGIANE